MQCGRCQAVSSAATRTLFDGGPWLLRDQLRALFVVATTEHTLRFRDLAGALGAGPLGVTPWLKRLRRIYREGWRTPLHGVVELTRVTVEVCASRRGSQRYVLALAVQTDGIDTGRLRAQRLPEVDGLQMASFVERAVAEGTTVRTSPWRGYHRLGLRGHVHHIPTRDAGLGNVAQLANILQVWAWSLEALNVDRFDIQLEDFVFRYDFRLRHAADDHGACFDHLVDLAVLDTPRERSRTSVAG